MNIPEKEVYWVCMKALFSECVLSVDVCHANICLASLTVNYKAMTGKMNCRVAEKGKNKHLETNGRPNKWCQFCSSAISHIFIPVQIFYSRH